MKRIIIFSLLMLMITGALPAQNVSIPEYRRETLDNGLVVLLMEYHKLPLMELRLAVRGGYSYDPAGSEGLADLTATLLRKGTEKRSATQIAEEIDFVGGSLRTGASRDYFVVSAEVLKKDLGTGMDLFSDVLLHPVFDAEELDRERRQSLADLEDVKDDPGSIASIYFNKIIYNKHPYGHQSNGTKTSLKKITDKDVKEFYRSVFIPNTSVLTIVGDFSSKEMLALVKKTFGGWKKKSPVKMQFPSLQVQKGRRLIVVDKSDLTQTQVRIGNVGVPRNNPDYFAIQVANSVLGDGFTSRLVDEIRVKRSLTYGAGSGFNMGLEGGMYQINTFTKNSTAREVIDVALAEVKKFRESGASPGELTKAQNYLAGNFARNLQAPEALAANITEMELYQLPKKYLETYFDKLKSVTLDDVKRVVNKYFYYDDLVILVVTNKQETLPMLESLGKVETVDYQDAIE